MAPSDVQTAAHDAEFFFRRGMAEKDAGKKDEAVIWLEQAVDADPEYAPAYLALGILYREQSELAEAEYCLRMVLSLEPQSGDAWLQLGKLCSKQGRNADALNFLRRAVELQENAVDALTELALVCERLGETDTAIESWTRVIALNPEDSAAYNNLGLLFTLSKGNIEQARVCFLKALQLNPGQAASRLNLYFAMAEAGELDEAIAGFDRLLEGPTKEEALFHRSLAYLKKGQFNEGWRDYGFRWGRPEAPLRILPFPDWSGDALRQRTVLIYAEQGLGDEIMFSSCLPDLLAREQGRVVLECAPRLEKLFQRSFPSVRVVGVPRTDHPPWFSDAGPIDCKMAIGDLPRLYRNTLDQFPSHSGYLRAAPERVDYWRRRLAKLGEGPKIGISWRGGLPHSRRDLRSIPLQQWMPLLTIKGAHYISLQYTGCREEIGALESGFGIPVHHWPEAINDYDETAALVSALDRIVTVCTSIVHLSGALGRPAWVLVPKTPEWRYLAQGERMPWYPSVRLLRQAAAGEWSAPLEEVARSLSEDTEC